jgi:exopolysaccharide biosynthesis protein
MQSGRSFPAVLAIVFAVCAPAAGPAPNAARAAVPACAAWCVDTVAPGVVWRRATLSIPDSSAGTVLVNVVDVDLTRPGVSVLPTRSRDSTYETVSSLGARTPSAVAGVNGGFFLYQGSDDICRQCSGSTCPAYRPSSLLQIADTAFSTNCLTARTTFGIDGRGGVEIAVIPADSAWKGMPSAIGAGPTLVSGGRPHVSTDQGFPWLYSAHPRTAVAIDGRGHLLLVTVDSPGLTLPELADFLVMGLGAREAMNFDGGGSTTMWIAGRGTNGVVNCPSAPGCTERAVYDGLFVRAN